MSIFYAVSKPPQLGKLTFNAPKSGILKSEFHHELTHRKINGTNKHWAILTNLSIQDDI
jgi:hypothetical protein